jgi:hypothetical protein
LLPSNRKYLHFRAHLAPKNKPPLGTPSQLCHSSLFLFFICFTHLLLQLSKRNGSHCECLFWRNDSSVRRTFGRNPLIGLLPTTNQEWGRSSSSFWRW